MKFLHIDPSNKELLEEFKNTIGKKPIFVLFYMEGCGPCNATRPEWKKLDNIKDKIHKDILIADIDNSLLEQLNEYPSIRNISGFPTMKFIKNKDEMSDYTGGRTVDDFVNWINSSLGSSSVATNKTNKTNKTKTFKGGRRRRTYKYRKSMRHRHRRHRRHRTMRS